MRPPLLLLAATLSVAPALAQTAPTPHAPVAVHPTHPAARHARTPLVKPPPSPAPVKVAPAAAAPGAGAAGTPVAAAAPASTAGAASPDIAKGATTGLPLPRWASLRTDEVNMRSGPGTRYPIDWVYKRRDLPVRITREFEQWRLVAAQDDTKGWVHQATLVGRRDFVVTGAERVLRDGPRDDAGAVARLAVGVVGRIRACAAQAAWCEVQVGEYRGWLPRAAFWGTEPGEAVQ